MKKIYFILAAFALCAAACSDSDVIGGQAPEITDKPAINLPIEAAEGELLIKFKPEMTEILDRTLKTRAVGGVSTRSGIPSTDEILSILGAYHFERVFPTDPKNEARTREAGMHLWYLIRFDENTDLQTAYNNLLQLGEITKVQCNRTIQRAYDPAKRATLVSTSAQQKMTRAASQGLPFNDPELYRQWGYINRGNYPFEQDWAKTMVGSDVNCEEAWKLCTGDPSIIVAVLDEAVMYNHPDLAANMWINEGEELHSNEDTDNNGYKGDKYGYNFVKNTGVISFTSAADTGHGTHVAGTIAAVNGNGEGVCGIAGGSNGKGGVKIMSCQIFDGQNGATLAAEAKAIKYAADNGAVILQCSWGYNSPLANSVLGYAPGPATEKEWETLYPLEKEALDYFIKNAGSPNGVIDGGLAIFASGNEYSAHSSFPAAYSKCISVAAIAADFTPSVFTNYGTEVSLSAPGGDTEYYGSVGVDDDDVDVQGSIYSTTVANGQPAYGYQEGTSMSCPHVSGVAALGLSYAVQQRRHFTEQEFRKLMIESGSELDKYYDGKIKLYHDNHFSPGATPTQINLNNYRGKMGRLANAGALLHLIANNGAEMKVPNMYVAPAKSITVDFARYFAEGENLTYTCTVANQGVATATVTGTQATINGVANGITTATVKGSNGKEQSFTITVRKNANDNGWM